MDVFIKNTSSVLNVTSLSSRRDAFTSDMQDYPQGAGSGIVWDQQGHVVVRSPADRSPVNVTSSLTRIFACQQLDAAHSCTNMQHERCRS